MGTKIEWVNNDDGTKGETWNPVTGCDKISPGCKNCYAESNAKRFWGDRKFTDVQCHDDRLKQPLHWKKPRKIFVCSMGDLLHEDVPDEFIIKVFKVMAQANQHTYMLLIKRPHRMRELLAAPSRIREIAGRDVWCDMDPGEKQSHIMLGVSVEMENYIYRIDYLRNTPAAVRFISFELLLGPMPALDLTGIHWVIVGGESGPKARPMDEDWVRDIRDQCVEAGVPFFYKQRLENGKKISMPELDGKVWDQMPNMKGGNND